MGRVGRVLAGLAGLALGLAALAQGTVYESRDKAGPVFSDKPSDGARPVDVLPPNVVAGPKVAPPAPPPPAASAPPYRTLKIVTPVAQGTVHSNTGGFEITTSVSPALRPGDRILVSLDGRLLPSSYRTARIALTDADWQAAAGSDRTEHTLQIAVADARGTLLIESAPVSFYARRATVGGTHR